MSEYFNKRYQVIFVDEYDNFWEVGWFDTLKEAEEPLNEHLKLYNLDEGDEHAGEVPQFGVDSNLGELTEYTGSFGPVFDRIIPVPEGCVSVRGFIREV